MLVERLQALRDAARDLPRQEAEYREADALLSDHARRLGLGDADALLATEPSDAERARVRRLVAESAKLEDRQPRHCGGSTTDAAADLAAAETKKNAAGSTRDPEPLRRRLAALRPDAEAVAGRIELSTSLDRRRDVLAQRAGRLVPAVPLDRLVGLALPPADAVGRFAGERAEFDKQSAELIARRKALMREVAGEEDARAGLGTAGSLPTADAVAAARAERDRLWGTARRFVLRAKSPNSIRPPARPWRRTSIRPSWRPTTSSTDATSRAAVSPAMPRSPADSRKRQGDTGARGRRSRSRPPACHPRRDVAGAVEPAGVAPGAPADMANWLGAVAALIGDREAVDTDAAKLDALALREEQLRPAVEALGDELDVRSEICRSPSPYARSKRAIAAVAENWQDRRDAARDLDKARAALTGIADAERELNEVSERWRGAWRQAMPAIGLRPEAGEDEAEAALAVWSDVPATRTKRATARHRVDQMKQTLAASRADVAALTGRIAPDLAAADHVAAIATLRDRLARGTDRPVGDAADRGRARASRGPARSDPTAPCDIA